MSAHARINALNGISDFAIQIANSARSTAYNSNVQSETLVMDMRISLCKRFIIGDTVSLWVYGSEGIGLADGNAPLTVYKLID